MGMTINSTMSGYPVGVPFKLVGSGSAAVQWILDPLLTVITGALTDLTLTVEFNAKGPATVTLTDQSGLKLPSAVTNLYGEGTSPKCDSTTCPTCSSCDQKSVSNLSCSCPTGGNSAAPVYNSSAAANFSNSIKVDQNFNVTLMSSCMAIQTLGSDLSLCFSRPNGTDAPRTDGVPMGTGGGQGAHIGFFRQVSFDPNPATPNFALVNAWDGSQTSYYFNYLDGLDQVWSAGPNGTNELRLVAATGQWREAGADRTYFDYDSQGRQFRRTALNGGQVYFAYDTNSRVQKITGDLPTAVYLEYNTGGNLSRVINGGIPGQADQIWTYDYQNVGTIGSTLTKINSPVGCSMYFGYDTRGEVVLELDALNYATYYEYAYFQYTGFALSKSIPPNAAPTLFTQSRPGFAMTKYTPAPALATYYVRDQTYPLIQYMTYDTAPAQQQAFSDFAGNAIATIDRLGRTSYYAYDVNRNQNIMQDPLSNSAYFGYNTNNRRTAAVSKRWTETGSFTGFTTYYAYDGSGNVTRTIDALNDTSASAYNRGGLRVQSVDPRGNPAYFGYDTYGRQVATKDALNGSAYFGYDGFGNQTRSVSKRWTETGTLAPFTSYYVYDLLNRPTMQIDAVGDITERDYSARCADGPIADYQLVQGIWRATYYVYDGMSRKARRIDPLKNVETWGYVGATTLVAQQNDKRGFGTYFGYDGQQRTVAQQDALGNAIYFGYDLVDNQTQSVGPRWPESTFFNFTTYYGYDALNRRAQRVDPVGNSTYFGYDANGNQKRVVSPRWKESSFAAFTTYYEYDAIDRQTISIDALGGRTYFGYDASSNRVRTQDARGNSTVYRFDALNRQAAVTDPLNNTALTGYDANGNTVRTQDPRGNTTYFEYDRIDRQTATIDALNEKVYFEYDQASNRVKRIDHLTSSTFALTYYGYDLLNRQIKQVDAMNRTTYYEYDANGNATKVIAPGSTAEVTTSFYDPLNRVSATVSPVGSTTYFGYDAGSNQTRLRNPRGFATYFGYDPLDRRSQTLDALQGSTYFGYDAAGNQTRGVGIRWKESSLASFTSYYQYDALNRRTQSIDAVGSRWLTGYDANGNVTQTLPPIGGATYYQYEARNLIQQVTNPVNNSTYFIYDAAGNRVMSLDGYGGYGTQAYGTSPYGGASNATYFSYDALNRVAKMLDGVGGAGYFGYDVAGNTSRVQDALFRTTYFTYDLIDRLTASTDALNNTSKFFYDLSSNRNVEVDASSHAVYYFYDASNRLASTRDALNAAAYYGYDLNSNLTQTLDNNKTPVYFFYDALDRRTNIIYPTESQYFGYDVGSNLVTMRDAWGGSYFAYDTLDRLSKRSNPRGDTLYYAYDAASELTRLKYPINGVGSSAGSTCYYGYDLALRNDRLTSPNLNGAYFGYDGFSNIVAKKYGNGMLGYFTYDRVNRVTSIRYFTANSTPVAYFDYARDIAGRITVIGRESDLAIYYAYDNIDRLTSETWRAKSTGAQIYAFSYAYDATNNRLKMRRESTAGVETSSAYYSYAADNSLTQRRVQTPPSTITDTYYIYDSNGAVIKQGNPATSYTYFEYGAHKLVTKMYNQFVMPDQQKVFSYDGQLNRYKLQFGAAYTSDLVWDGLNLLEERRSDLTGNMRMTYGPSRIYGIGGNVEIYDDGATGSFYPAIDHRGTVHVLIDDLGAEYGRRYYDAFGVIINEAGHWRTFLGYQSNWLMPAVQMNGFCLSKYRMYECATGVFLSRDFLPYLNKYRAFSNNPVGQVDSNGLADATATLQAIEVDISGLKSAQDALRVYTEYTKYTPKELEKWKSDIRQWEDWLARDRARLNHIYEELNAPTDSTTNNAAPKTSADGGNADGTIDTFFKDLKAEINKLAIQAIGKIDLASFFRSEAKIQAGPWQFTVKVDPTSTPRCVKWSAEVAAVGSLMRILGLFKQGTYVPPWLSEAIDKMQKDLIHLNMLFSKYRNAFSADVHIKIEGDATIKDNQPCISICKVVIGFTAKSEIYKDVKINIKIEAVYDLCKGEMYATGVFEWDFNIARKKFGLSQGDDTVERRLESSTLYNLFKGNITVPGTKASIPKVFQPCGN